MSNVFVEIQELLKTITIRMRHDILDNIGCSVGRSVRICRAKSV